MTRNPGGIPAGVLYWPKEMRLIQPGGFAHHGPTIAKGESGWPICNALGVPVATGDPHE